MDTAAFPSPCFILDEDKLRAHMLMLQQLSQRCDIDILLALKGFAYWRVFRLMAPYLQGAAVSSLHEARLVHEEMGGQVHAYAPVYMPTQVKDLLPYVTRMSFNSLAEYARYGARARQGNVSCGLRIQPGYSLAPSPFYDPATPGSRFGVSATELVKGLPSGIEGLHLHALCEADSYALEKVLVAANDRFGQFFGQLQWLNLGGGHLLTDKRYDIPHFRSTIATFQASYPNLRLIFEPSSAIAWHAGVLTSTVLDIVERDGIQTAILDVSFTCHLPDCLEMPYRPHVQGAVLDGSLPYCYRLGGASCLAGDFLENYSFSTPLQLGDKLIFENMMHYSMVKTTQFNGLVHPSLGIWQQDKGATLVKTFTYAQYKDKLS